MPTFPDQIADLKAQLQEQQELAAKAEQECDEAKQTLADARAHDSDTLAEYRDRISKLSTVNQERQDALSVSEAEVVSVTAQNVVLTNNNAELMVENSNLTLNSDRQLALQNYPDRYEHHHGLPDGRWDVLDELSVPVGNFDLIEQVADWIIDNV